MRPSLLLALTLVSGCFVDEDVGHNDGGDPDAAAPGSDATPEDFEILVRGPKFAHDVVSDADNLYWVTVNQSVERSSIRRVAKTGGLDEELWLVGKRIYQITADDTHVYAAVYGVNPVGPGDVARVPKTGGAPEILVAGVDWTHDVAVDEAFVYYSHFDGSSAQEISRAPKTGGAPELLVGGVEGGADLAVDAAFLYYTEGNEGRVMRVAKAGGGPEELAGGWVGSKHLVLDGGHLYFTACSTGDCPMVEHYRMAVDGADLTLLATLPGQGDIAIGGGYYLVASRAGGSVYALPLAGGAPATLVSGRPGPMASAIDADGAWAYWVDFDNGDVGRVGVVPAEE